MVAAKGVKKLTHYFAPAARIPEIMERQPGDPESITREEALLMLSEITAASNNARANRQLRDISKYDYLRYFAIQRVH